MGRVATAPVFAPSKDCFGLRLSGPDHILRLDLTGVSHPARREGVCHMDLPILNNPAPRPMSGATNAFHGCASRPLPMSVEEMRERGWDEADVVFVTGDAYIDHPSFAMAILGRVLEAAGYRVAIVSQPDWRNCDAWRLFGKPRLFFAISAGNMDSMINHYTANRKVRNSDAYSPGGRIGLRPDRATLAYCQHAAKRTRAFR